MLSVPPHVNPFQMSLDGFAFRKVGVFDGHGPFGHEIANFVQESLPRDFLQSQSFQQNDVEKALKEAFLETQKKCKVPSCFQKWTVGTFHWLDEWTRSNHNRCYALKADMVPQSKVLKEVSRRRVALIVLWVAPLPPWHLSRRMFCGLSCYGFWLSDSCFDEIKFMVGWVVSSLSSIPALSVKTSNGTTHLIIRQVNIKIVASSKTLCVDIHVKRVYVCVCVDVVSLDLLRFVGVVSFTFWQSSGTLLMLATPLEFWQRRPATHERHMAGSRSPDFIDCLMKMRGAQKCCFASHTDQKRPCWNAEVFMPRIKGMSSYRMVGHKDTHQTYHRPIISLIFLGWTFACLW